MIDKKGCQVGLRSFGSNLPLDCFKVQQKLAGTEVNLLWWKLYCFCCFVLHLFPFVTAFPADSITLWTKRLLTLYVSLLVLLRGVYVILY